MSYINAEYASKHDITATARIIPIEMRLIRGKICTKMAAKNLGGSAFFLGMFSAGNLVGKNFRLDCTNVQWLSEHTLRICMDLLL